MSETKEQANVMIGYLFQIMYERGEMLRQSPNTKEAERAAGIIHSLARSISILREDYGMYDRAPEPAPPTEPAQYDQERTEDTETEPEEDPQPV